MADQIFAAIFWFLMGALACALWMLRQTINLSPPEHRPELWRAFRRGFFGVWWRRNPPGESNGR